MPLATLPHCSNDIFIKKFRFLSTDENSKFKLKLKSGRIELPMCNSLPPKLQSQKDHEHALMNALDCGKEDLKKIQEENLFWRNFPIDTIVTRIKEFKELGVQQTDLVEHSSVLFIDFGNDVNQSTLLSKYNQVSK